MALAQHPSGRNHAPRMSHSAQPPPAIPVPPPGAAAPSARPTAPLVLRCVGLWSDDPDALPGWRAALADEGLATALFDERGAALDARCKPDALVLRVTRSLSEHLARLRELRAQWPLIPVVVACRSQRELDHILALEMGADDVLDCECSAPVVAARLRALWRTATLAANAMPSVDELRFGSLLIQLRERRVTHQERVLALTEGEFEVLWLLASHPGSVLARRDILRQVRGLDDHLLDRSIDSRVYRIRAKLGDTGAAQSRIRTVRNRGYLFSPVGW
jgi:two-component system, OmpR family, response regulator RstA